MAYVVFSPNARRHVVELFTGPVTDDALFARFETELGRVAENPASRTEPAKLPHHPNRLMTNFVVEDGVGRPWRFDLGLRRLADEDGIFILTVRAAPLP